MANAIELTDEEKEVAQNLYCQMYVVFMEDGKTGNMKAKIAARQAVDDFKEDIIKLNIKKQF